MSIRVPIDPNVDTELDVITRVLDSAAQEISTRLTSADIARSIRLNLLRLRSKKDLQAINSIDANDRLDRNPEVKERLRVALHSDEDVKVLYDLP